MVYTTTYRQETPSRHIPCLEVGQPVNFQPKESAQSVPHRAQ